MLRLLALQGVHGECATQRVHVRTLLPPGTSTAHQSLQQLSRVLWVLQLGGLKADLLRKPLRRHAQDSRSLLQAERPAESGLHRQDLTLTTPDGAGFPARQHNTAEQNFDMVHTYSATTLRLRVVLRAANRP